MERKNAVRVRIRELGSRTFPGFFFSEVKESVFCMFCIKHKGKLTAEHNMEAVYITKRFNNWKKALEVFVDHQQSIELHGAAIIYEFVVSQCGDVLEMTVNDLNNKRLAERKYLIKIRKFIRFLARQGLAFSGNDGNDNLTQLFKLLNKNDPALLARLDKEGLLESGQHKYIHNDIQRFPVQVRLLPMCRGEFSGAIARLMSKCL